MIAFLVTVYAVLVLVLFKLRIVKPRPYPIACLLVVGAGLVVGIVIAWFQCAPMSSRVVTTQYVVQIVPYVKGQVRKVHAAPNQPVRQGDLLLEINPAPYQYAVDQLEAQLHAAEQNVKQAAAGLEAAKANVLKSKAAVVQARAGVAKAKASVADARAGVNKAKASADLARTQEKMVLGTMSFDTGAVSKLKVAEAEQKRKEADAALAQAETGVSQAVAAQQEAEAGVKEAQFAEQQAEAAEKQAGFALEVARSNVVSVQSQLADARFNLEQCRVTAPADGYVVDWQVRDGTMIVPAPLSPAGTFVETGETTVVAVFPQNHLANVRPGDEVELVLDPYPGRLFQGEVDVVIPATGEGQFAPGGAIPKASTIGSQGLLALKIRLRGDAQPPGMPLGAGGAVAIYTGEGKPVHVVSKVAIRMKKWLLYVLPG
jgi:multidrug resistance efflux pump